MKKPKPLSIDDFDIQAIREKRGADTEPRWYVALRGPDADGAVYAGSGTEINNAIGNLIDNAERVATELSVFKIRNAMRELHIGEPT